MWDFTSTPTYVTTHRQDSRSYYSADQRMMYHQVNRDSLNTSSGTPEGRWGAWEEYWYDALGRRVLKYSYQDAGNPSTQGDGLCEVSTRCYTSTERYVWDGAQLLWELRHQGGGNDATPSGSDLTGVIGYVHARGIDIPLAMLRNSTSLTLHANWRGLFVGATTTSGQDCVAASACNSARWPGDEAGALRGLDVRATPSWYGSLALDQQDASGLLYRRNRYYDPVSGQFTQEDPIGIAGGLNLYGYANGDPINFSDPFGLCPWCIGAVVGFAVERTAQLITGRFDPMALGTATVLGGLSGGLSVASGVRTAFRYAGQGAIGAAAGLAQSEGDCTFSEAAFNAALGVGGEFAGELVGAVNAANVKGYIQKTIVGLESGSLSVIAEGSSRASLIGRLTQALEDKRSLESFLSGLAVGLAGLDEGRR